MNHLENLSKELGLKLVNKKRGPKPNPYSQLNLIKEVLLNGGSYTELELGKLTRGYESLGSRALISQLRKYLGIPIATRPRYNPKTKRYNVEYYYEPNQGKYIKYCMENGEFNFKKGPRC